MVAGRSAAVVVGSQSLMRLTLSRARLWLYRDEQRTQPRPAGRTRPTSHATFTAVDGQHVLTTVMEFRRYPGWRVVLALVPGTGTGTVPGPEHFKFTG